MLEKKKQNGQPNVTERTALLKQQSKRLSKPRTKDRLRHAALAAADIVSHRHTKMIHRLKSDMSPVL